ncbi:Fibulin 1 [Operophtera brumata]|uniref:Fibulin 1 n=1 Tax=Operophtera brumata TaxID=104452 RepID=A0A0L7LSY0_OPEBR|nr:Fibulin 1 [Operophtera brumata]
MKLAMGVMCLVSVGLVNETTTEKKVLTTTEKPKDSCKKDSCAHNCDDADGVVRCSCREGFRLQADKKSCNDINECAEAQDDLCIAEDTVCHNIPGAFKCVPIKKRDLGYKCNGKPGKPFEELVPGINPGGSRVTEPPSPDLETPKNDICPPGFRAGADDECDDDCQRLSQYCINTHGSFFCQDHVSKRCAPGFKVNSGTGVCEDPTNEVIQTTPKPTTPKPTTPKPTTPKPTTPKPTTTSTTTPKPTTYTTVNPRPTYPPRTTPKPTRRPYSPYQAPESTPTRPEDRRPVYNPYGANIPEDPRRPEEKPRQPEDPIDNDPRRPEDPSRPTNPSRPDPRPRRPPGRRPPYRRPTTTTEPPTTTTVAPGFDPNDVHCLYVPVQPPRQPADPGSNVITVGSQYGQRGPWSPRPSYSRTGSGDVLASCPWGYKLTPEKRCYDIDECTHNSSSCGSQQTCENFYGGYSCQCPAGHKLVGQNGLCEDVDECTETPDVCEQSCANAWGGYRCYCKRGYRLASDNSRGKLCGGECVNEPGSYRCGCPSGYRLSEDQRSCIAFVRHIGLGVPTATRQLQLQLHYLRGQHLHTFGKRESPSSASTCTLLSFNDSCLFQRDQIRLALLKTLAEDYAILVDDLYGDFMQVDLFTMHGPSWTDSVVSFEMRMVRVQASRGVTPASMRCFDMRPSGNVCVISLLCSLGGPQVAELELSMSLYQRGTFAGSTVARLVVIVSEYEY